MRASSVVALRVGQRARHVGVDEARRDAVDGDVAAADFLRERLGEADAAPPWPRRSWPGPGCRDEPTTEPIWMMRPWRAFIMPRSTAFARRNTGFRLVAMMASHSSSFMRSSRLSRVMPALLTRIVDRAEARLDVGERGLDRRRRR